MKISWKHLLIAFAVFSLVKMVGCGTAQNGQETREPAEPAPKAAGEYNEAQAKETYQNSCASCHGNNLEGGFGPSMEKIGSKLSKDEIDGIIQNGVGSMPAQKQVSDADRDNLAAWLAEQK